MSGAVIMHQNRLMRRFQDAQATSPKSAVTLADLGCRNSWVFRRMVARGVFVETGDGRYYMDEKAAQWFVKMRRRRMLTFLAVAVVICLVWLVFCWLLGAFEEKHRGANAISYGTIHCSHGHAGACNLATDMRISPVRRGNRRGECHLRQGW